MIFMPLLALAGYVLGGIVFISGLVTGERPVAPRERWSNRKIGAFVISLIIYLALCYFQGMFGLFR